MRGLWRAARYGTGYLGDIRVLLIRAYGFMAWFEAYLGGRWYTLMPATISRVSANVLMARGRDATDVAIVTSFGPCMLAGFRVFTDEVTSADSASG